MNDAEKTNLYSSDDPNNDQVNLEEKGFDLSVGQAKPAMPSLAPESENVVDSIVKQATVDKGEEDKILQELETMDPSLNVNVPIAPVAESGAKVAKIIFFVILVIAIAVIGYFYANQKGIEIIGLKANTSLSEARTKLEEIKMESISNEFELAALNYRQLGYLVSQLSAESSSDDPLSSRNLEKLKEQTSEVIVALTKNLETSRVKLAEESKLQDAILIYMADLQKETADPEDKKLLNEALKIVNESLRNIKGELAEGERTLEDSLKEIDLVAMSDQQILAKLTDALGDNLTNPYARIGYIQEKRIKWSEVIAEIEQITQTVDPNFSLEGVVSEEGISYSSFSFNAEDNRVSVAGQTKTSNLKTFSRIADLTDAIDASDIFANADTRTFSKQADGDGYKSSIRLDFDLENS